MSNVINFDFNTKQVRTVRLGGEWWFVAADVVNTLQLKGTTGNHYRKLDASEQTKVNRIDLGMTPGKPMTLISESGLYKLVMRSDKPEAKKFQDWVTRDVLPAIRKDGAYIMGEEKVASGELSEDEFILQAMTILQGKVERLRAENAMLQPKAEVYDAILDATGTMTTTDVAKTMGMSAQALNRKLSGNRTTSRFWPEVLRTSTYPNL
ncbi:BRO family protein [Marinobacter nauticus]|uniref:BRO family protein n=1 Tax=Marinobacter nauticus TaxID=2743 RepID=UPI001CD75A07|nr:BRO family protein [Marinobacter nauticus]MCA0912890.1 phage antirepressor KilAC domain-containing protein [Marinobacter nauticus]